MGSTISSYLRLAYRHASSMRAGLALFGLVMVISLSGTLVPAWAGLYHTWPFGILLGLLVANTGLCTVRQGGTLFRTRGLGLKRLLRAWSVWLIHVAVLLVASGSLWSALAGRDGSVELAVGETARIPADMAGGRDWEISLLDFHADYNPDGSPSGWRSSLDLHGFGQTAGPGQEISVNHPLEREGVSILQASWGSRYEVTVEAPGAGPAAGSTRQSTVNHNELLALDAAGDLGIVLQDPQPGSEAIPYLAVIGGKVAGPAQASIGKTVEVDGQGLRFTITRRIATSGLMLRYDPAVPFLWFGFGLLGLAVCGVFLGKGRP